MSFGEALTCLRCMTLSTSPSSKGSRVPTNWPLPRGCGNWHETGVLQMVMFLNPQAAIKHLNQSCQCVLVHFLVCQCLEDLYLSAAVFSECTSSESLQFLSKILFPHFPSLTKDFKCLLVFQNRLMSCHGSMYIQEEMQRHPCRCPGNETSVSAWGWPVCDLSLPLL